MDFSFNETQVAIRDLARKILTDRVTPAALKAVEAEPDRFARGLWTELAAAGLLGIAVPEGAGGGGHGLLEVCALLEQAGATVAPVPLWAATVLGAMPIAEFGNAEQKQRLLPGVVTGDTILTGALTELGNDDPASPETTATPRAGGYALNGVKICVPAAHLAQRILVAARVGNDGVGVFLVDPRAAGVTVERQIATTGEPQGRLTLVNAHVPEANVLADANHGAKVLEWLVPRAAVALCAQELGVVQRVLKMTAEYTTTRQQFERPIATFQAVSQRAADAFIDVETIRVTTWQAAWRLSEGLPASRAVAIAKFWSAEAGHRVVYAAQHLHGGMGFDLDYPLHRYYLLSKQIELTLGGGTQHLVALGAEIARD